MKFPGHKGCDQRRRHILRTGDEQVACSLSAEGKHEFRVVHPDEDALQREMRCERESESHDEGDFERDANDVCKQRGDST